MKNEDIAARFERLEIQPGPRGTIGRAIEWGGHRAGPSAIEALKKLVQRQASTLEGIELERVKSSNPKPPHYQ